MDAVTLAAHIRAKRLSPVEVIDAVLARMERLEPHLHALCTPTPELARAEAKRVEAEVMAGRPSGPLAGVPLSHKDLILTRGVRTASGSLAYKDFIPDEGPRRRGATNGRRGWMNWGCDSRRMGARRRAGVVAPPGGAREAVRRSARCYECLTFFSASTISGTALNRSATRP
ncbi:MAG TPA: amidase family protein [Candidatus Binataceae bacterium]